MRTRLAAPLVLLTALAVGCGGDGGSEGGSESASGDEAVTSEQFCDSFTAIETTEDFESTKSAIGEMADQGLPEEAPEEAVAGFEVLTDLAAEADDEKEANKLGEDIDAEGQASVQAFFEYSATTCAEEPAPEDGESPADEPTDEPTE